MESIKTRRKGLTSLVLLLISVAMLATSTFAWFTDTATVKGSKINAGNLSVEIYAGEELLKGIFEKENPEVTWDDGKNTFISDLGLTDEDKYDTSSTLAYRVSDINLAVISLEKVEPGQAYPVKNLGVVNTGDLAISYTAGFAIEESKTGLKTLFVNTPENDVLKQSLLAKQAKKDADGSLVSDWADYVEADDMGGHLEDVMVVYAWDGSTAVDSVVKYYEGTEEDIAAGHIKNEIDKTASNYIGTISQIIHANDAAYIAGLDPVDDAAEIAELIAVQGRIKAASSGYCLPYSALGNDAKYDTKVSVKTATNNDDHFEEYGEASAMGKLNYLIVMPKLAGNEYQNASLELSVGVTASQVEFEADGTGYRLYDAN